MRALALWVVLTALLLSSSSAHPVSDISETSSSTNMGDSAQLSPLEPQQQQQLPFTYKSSKHGALSKTKIKNRIIMIRHGEKTAAKPGLSKQGKARAECMRQIFGKGGEYDIGLIIAQSFNPVTRSRIRPYLTVKPLARDLHLPVHVGCDRTDGACVRRLVRSFASSSSSRRSRNKKTGKRKDILICWKHSEMAHIARSLGAKARREYPDERYDLMWLFEDERVVEERSERCAGLDDLQIDVLEVPDDEDDEEDDDDLLDWSTPALEAPEEEGQDD